MKNLWKQFCKYFWRVVLFATCFLFLKGCWGLFYVKMTHLSDDELEWVTNPIKYQRGTFESDSGNQATLIMLDHSISNSKNPFYFNVVEGDEYEAKARYSYMVKLPKDKFDGFFYVIKSVDNDSLVWWSMLNMKYSFLDIPLRDTTITHFGKSIKNCVIVDSINSKPYDWNVKHYGMSEEYPIESYVISKDYGLIYFKLESGEQYYRKFKEVTDTTIIIGNSEPAFQ